MASVVRVRETKSSSLLPSDARAFDARREGRRRVALQELRGGALRSRHIASLTSREHLGREPFVAELPLRKRAVVAIDQRERSSAVVVAQRGLHLGHQL